MVNDSLPAFTISFSFLQSCQMALFYSLGPFCLVDYLHCAPSVNVSLPSARAEPRKCWSTPISSLMSDHLSTPSFLFFRLLFSLHIFPWPQPVSSAAAVQYSFELGGCCCYYYYYYYYYYLYTWHRPISRLSCAQFVANAYRRKL
jgi:hypothetical protein